MLEADILLISEGAYPYISGGVSTWVQTLIERMPQHRFLVLFLGSRKIDYESMKYQLPENVIHLEEHYLFDHVKPESGSKDYSDKQYDAAVDFHKMLKHRNSNCQFPVTELIDILFSEKNGISEEQFLTSESSWAYISESYEEYCTNPSFIDYFWTVRNIHSPIWRLVELVKRLPKVKVVHTVSTGYAGFIGSLLHYRDQVSLLLSEHGIYTKERRIDLLQNRLGGSSDQLNQDKESDYLHELWVNFFDSIGYFCYQASEKIVSLYQGAAKKQREDGADAEKQKVIPNGIDIARLKQFRHTINLNKKTLCLLGRVVAIKDIKTFIQAIKVLASKRSDFIAQIVGPLDEDPDYVEECRQLIKVLEVEDFVELVGKKRLDEVLPKIDLMVLSSISEGMPLAVLEGFAAGIPAVATDVGSCRELIEGYSDEDKQIGLAGRVVPIRSSQGLAQGILALLDEGEWQQASNNAITRTERFYSLETMIADYDALYKEAASWRE